MNDGGMGSVGVVDSYHGVGWGTRGGYHLIGCFLFLFVLLSFGLSYPVSFLSEWSMIVVVSVSSLLFVSFVSGVFN